MADVALTHVLFALSDPARLQIVRDLAAGPLEMAQCGATNPALPKSTKSHLMKVLREAGVIEGDRRGTWIYYRVKPDTLRLLSESLAPAQDVAVTA